MIELRWPRRVCRKKPVGRKRSSSQKRGRSRGTTEGVCRSVSGEYESRVANELGPYLLERQRQERDERTTTVEQRIDGTESIRKVCWTVSKNRPELARCCRQSNPDIRSTRHLHGLDVRSRSSRRSGRTLVRRRKRSRYRKGVSTNASPFQRYLGGHGTLTSQPQKRSYSISVGSQGVRVWTTTLSHGDSGAKTSAGKKRPRRTNSE